MGSDVPGICRLCPARPCERSEVGTVDLCPYGIVYQNAGDQVLRREPTTPLRHLAANLRHEVSPILSFIVNEVSRLSPDASTRNVDIDTPEGRILGATVILDETVQMITGVHDFHPLRVGSHSVGQSLRDLVLNRFAMHSLLGGANRSHGLMVDTQIEPSIQVVYGRTMLEYIMSVLMDNIWKFSIPDSVVLIRAAPVNDGLCVIEITNVSSPIPTGLDIFDLGSKAQSKTRGFGYGLHWAKLLGDRYNDGLDDTEDPMQLTHDETRISDTHAEQTFTLINVRIGGSRHET